jgi:diacylglycerol kinase (ATP)
VTWEQVVSVIALVLAVVAVVIGLVVLQKVAAARAQVPGLLGQVEDDEGPARTGPPAFVINPTKTRDVEAVHALALELCAELGHPEPLWLETTPEDPGRGQAEQALAAGASVVVAAGGDGTVRAVAGALAGTRTPMGLLPLGTGNLLARNLDLPVEGTRSLIATALTGAEHPIDLGWIRAEPLLPPDADHDTAPEVDAPHATDSPPAGEPPQEHVFLVMAGVGFDAAMVAGADEQLKSRMGWLAYFVAGARHLHGRKIRLQMTIGGGHTVPLKLRSLLFANCGRLPGGIVLLPDADIADGWLDIAALDTRGGVLGWASLFGKVILQGLGVRRQLPGQPGSIDFWRGREIEVRCETPEPVQVDGDLIGESLVLHVRTQPGGLVVRTR